MPLSRRSRIIGVLSLVLASLTTAVPSTAGATPPSYATAPADWFQLATTLHAPIGLTSDSSGNLDYFDFANNVMQIPASSISSAISTSTTIINAGNLLLQQSPLSHGTFAGMQVAASGTVYYADGADPTVYQLTIGTPSTSQPLAMTCSPTIVNAGALLLRGNTLYFGGSPTSGPGGIWAVDISTGACHQIVAGVENVGQMVTDNNGNLFFTAMYGVYEVPSADLTTSTALTVGQGVIQIASITDRLAEGLAMDSRGDLLFATDATGSGDLSSMSAISAAAIQMGQTTTPATYANDGIVEIVDSSTTGGVDWQLGQLTVYNGRLFATSRSMESIFTMLLSSVPALPAPIYPVTAPSAPTGLGVVGSGSTITATWNPVSNATGYVCTLMSGFATATSYTTATGSTSCSFTGLDPAITYGIKVVALHGTYASSGVTAFESGNSSTSSGNSSTSTPRAKSVACINTAGTHSRRFFGRTTCPSGWHRR